MCAAQSPDTGLLDDFAPPEPCACRPPAKPVDRIPGCLVQEHRAAGARTAFGAGALRCAAGLSDRPWPRGDRQGGFAITSARHRRRDDTRIRPRYLHSTGQYTRVDRTRALPAAAAPDAPRLPYNDYSFSVLKQAQAPGISKPFVAAGRDVVHLHFDRPSVDFRASHGTVLRNQFDLFRVAGHAHGISSRRWSQGACFGRPAAATAP